MEGRGKLVIVQYTATNVKQVTVGRALTPFIVDHIRQGRMEGKGKVSASSVYSNQRETEVTVVRALTRFIETRESTPST